jgi:hypothetical protein
MDIVSVTPTLVQFFGRTVKRVLVTCAILALADCGGGGGGSSAMPPAAAQVDMTQSRLSAQSTAVFTSPRASSLVGTWLGKLTQGSTDYKFTIHVTSGTTTLKGTSRIQSGKYFGVMSFTASVAKSTVDYAEIAILKQNPPPGGYWCIKSATLTLSQNRTEMSGPWTAPGCTPGTLEVHLQQ